MNITRTYCDRCGKEVTYPVKRELYLSTRGGEYDLCDSCYNELYSWFKMEEINDGTNNRISN